MPRTGIDRKYALILLFACAVLLTIGIIAKPKAADPKPPPSEREMAYLQRLAQQRRLRDLSSYLADAADFAGEWVLSLPSLRQSALVWDSEGRVLAPKNAAAGDSRRSAIASDGNPLTLAPVRLAPDVPFALFQVSDPRRLPSAPRPSSQQLGEWVIVAGKNSNNQVVFAHGLFQGTAAAQCGTFNYQAVQSSASLSPSLLGGGVFTLQGELLGFIAECEGQPIAISGATIADALKRPVTLNDQLEASYGLRIAGSSAGVQVVAVWDGSLAKTAGVKAGDFVTAIDDRPVTAEADLAALGTAPAAHVLQIRRGKRSIPVKLEPPTPDADNEVLPVGFALAARGAAVVERVRPGSGAARAGVREGDILRKIGGTRVADRSGAIRVLKGVEAGSVLLTLERNGKEIDLVVNL